MLRILSPVIVRDRQTRLGAEKAEPVSHRTACMPGALPRQLRQTKPPVLPFKNDVERNLAGPRHDGVRLPMAELKAVVNRRGAVIDTYPVGDVRALVFAAVAYAIPFAMSARQAADQLERQRKSIGRSPHGSSPGCEAP